MTHDEGCAMLEDVYRKSIEGGCEPSWFRLGMVVATGSFSDSVNGAIQLIIQRRVLLSSHHYSWLGTRWVLEAKEAKKLHIEAKYFSTVFMFAVYVSRRLKECSK